MITDNTWNENHMVQFKAELACVSSKPKTLNPNRLCRYLPEVVVRRRVLLSLTGLLLIMQFLELRHFIP